MKRIRRNEPATGMEAAFIRYDDWAALVGGPVQIRRFGTVVRTGVVDTAMPDSTALWIQDNGSQPRTSYSKAEGYEAWISPRQLQPRAALRPVISA